MSSSYIVDADPFWDPYRAPMAVPQETAKRGILQVLPQANYAGNFNKLGQVQFKIQDSDSQLDWYNSYIEASFNIVTSTGSFYSATQNVTLVREPQFFINAKMTLGGRQVEQGTPYQTTACWLQHLMTTSAAAKNAQGVQDLSYPDIVTVPADETTWPPSNLGCQSISKVIGAGSADATVATQNPLLNTANIKRLAKTAGSRVGSFLIPLSSIYSFVTPETPTFWGGVSTLTLQPAPAEEVIFNSVDTSAYLSCTQLVLWVATRTARSDVMRRLLEEAALGKSTKYQWLACEVPQYIQVASGAKSLNQPITLTDASPQYMAIIFKPQSYNTQATMNQLALPPNPIVSSCPYSSAYVTYSGQTPQFAYGVNDSADRSRLYQAFKEMCDQLNPMGAGCYVDQDQFESQQFVTVFDLRNRDPNAAPVSTPSNQATLALTFSKPIGGAANVWVITFGVKEVEFNFSTNGIAISQGGN